MAETPFMHAQTSPQRLLLLSTLAAFLGLLAVVVSKGLFPVEAGFRPLPIAPQ